ncbi:eCIS core domain-containing protein [Thermococcus sp.]
MKMKEKIAVALIAVLILSLAASVQTIRPKENVLSEAQAILKSVEAIRGLQFKEPPRIVVLTRAEAEKMFKPGKPDVERMRLEGDVYKMSLLLKPDYPYVHEKVEQSVGWIAATVGDTIYIIEENFLSDPATAKRVIAHESVHVLQKQWFNAPYGGPTLDTTKAIQAAIEGDADLVADIYCNETGIPIHKITDLYTRDPVTDLGIFPYVYGDRFVAYLYRKGGWSLVNSMYGSLPNTTKDVMFPKLYLENWTPVNLREGAVAMLPKGSKIVYSNRMGAFYVFLIYWGHGASMANSTEMAEAWVGDWLVVGDSKEGNLTNRTLVWNVEFKDSESAADFADFLRGLARGNPYAHFTIKEAEKRVVLRSWRMEGAEGNEGKTALPDLWKGVR